MASPDLGFWCCLGRKKGRQDPHARNKKNGPSPHLNTAKPTLYSLLPAISTELAALLGTRVLYLHRADEIMRSDDESEADEIIELVQFFLYKL